MRSLLIASGIVRGPTSHLDFQLPEGFASFEMEWSDVLFSTDENLLGLVVSHDGGTTWVLNPTDEASPIWYHSGTSSTETQEFVTFMDFGNFLVDAKNGTPSYCQATIWPGDGERYHQIFATGRYGSARGPQTQIYNGTMLPAAPLGRVNAIRVAPAGLFDPEQSDAAAETIYRGSYRLYGLEG